MNAIQYKRPTSLSDPFCDFLEEDLKGILAKSDEELGSYEYMCIFGEFLPAGTYEECAYFISPLLKYLDRLDRAGDSDVVDHFLGWMITNRERLRADGVYQELENYFKAMLKRYLSSLDVRQNSDGCWYLCGVDVVEELLGGLNVLADGLGDVLLREALQGDVLAPHVWACDLVHWQRIVPIDRGSALLDDLAQKPIVGSRSARIVEAYLQKNEDPDLTSFWSQYQD